MLIHSYKAKQQKMSIPGENVQKQFGLSVTVDEERKLFQLCLGMDATGSMRNEIVAARNTLVKNMKSCREMYPEHTFEVALVIFRDYHDRERFLVRDFTTDVSAIENVLKTVGAYGGGDTAEDVTGALDKIRTLSWKGQVQQVLLVGDAPCHGRKYHDGVSDHYPDGDKYDLDPEEIMKELASKNIGVMAFQMNASTKIMFKLFDMAFQQGRIPGSKANFILSDVSEQLEQAKLEHRRKVEEESRIRMVEERRRWDEYNRRVEEERRLAREAFIAEHGEIPEDLPDYEEDADGDRCMMGVSRGGGDEEDEEEMNPRRQLRQKWLEMQRARMNHIEPPSEYVGMKRGEIVEIEESPSEALFTKSLLSAVSSQMV